MTLNIAVLGLGVMGSFHTELLSTVIRGARITVVNDFVPAKAEEVAARVGARVAIAPARGDPHLQPHRIGEDLRPRRETPDRQQPGGGMQCELFHGAAFIPLRRAGGP